MFRRPDTTLHKRTCEAALHMLDACVVESSTVHSLEGCAPCFKHSVCRRQFIIQGLQRASKRMHSSIHIRKAHTFIFPHDAPTLTCNTASQRLTPLTTTHPNSRIASVSHPDPCLARTVLSYTDPDHSRIVLSYTDTDQNRTFPHRLQRLLAIRIISGQAQYISIDYQFGSSPDSTIPVYCY